MFNKEEKEENLLYKKSNLSIDTNLEDLDMYKINIHTIHNNLHFDFTKNKIKKINNQEIKSWVEETEKLLMNARNIKILKNSLVTSYNFTNHLIALEDKFAGKKLNSEKSELTLHKIRTTHTILANGHIERFISFRNNDLPGVMLASSFEKYIHRYGVVPDTNPVIFTNNLKDTIIAIGKIDEFSVNTRDKLQLTLNNLAAQNNPIEIDLGDGSKDYIFYAPSELITRLKYYPYIQFGVIGLFLIIAYILFSTARKAEQDQVWVGMSKETAHQLGTPLSSLMAWNEHLITLGVDEAIVSEMNQDVKRLNTITDRFSKIGSQPTLSLENINLLLTNALDYLKKRTSRNVVYTLNLTEKDININLCAPLFEWVIENLCKNAVDTMDGKGSITVNLTNFSEGIFIDIIDTGKGIPKSKFKTIFEPGYTTKKRGWGLGLSLCKRIIESYHHGKIQVIQSEINKGTTFRIELKKLI